MYVPDADVDPDRIFQGDIFEEFPCFFLPSTDFRFLREDGETYSEEELPGGWRAEELLIVRASCDIHEEARRNLFLEQAENYTYQLILYCPVIPLNELQNYRQLREAVKDRDKALNQNLPGGAFFLAEKPPQFPDSVAYPHWVCAVTKAKANRFKTFDPKRRIASLASPFRESFANKFGQTIARVALPTGAFADHFVNNAPAPTQRS